jgi:ABC-type uncharacterized transport system permease subunit
MSNVILFIGIMLMYSTPLALAAEGSVISERCGVVNIGIEGMMTIGAFTGAAVGYFTGSAWIGFLCAGIAGGVFGLLHAWASVSGKADQTVSGIAINLIAPGLAPLLKPPSFRGRYADASCHRQDSETDSFRPARHLEQSERRLDDRPRTALRRRAVVHFL